MKELKDRESRNIKDKARFFNVSLNKMSEIRNEFSKEAKYTDIYKPIKNEKNGEYSLIRKALDDEDIYKSSYYEQFKFLQKLHAKEADEKTLKETEKEIETIQSKIEKLCTQKNGNLEIDNLKYKKLNQEIKKFLEEIHDKKPLEEKISKINWHDIDNIYKLFSDIGFKNNKIKKKLLYDLFKKLDENIIEQYWKGKKPTGEYNDKLVLLRDSLNDCFREKSFGADLRDFLYKKFKWLDPSSYALKEKGDSLYKLISNIEENMYIIESLKCLVSNIERDKSKIEQFNNFVRNESDHINIMKYLVENIGSIPDSLKKRINLKIKRADNVRKSGADKIIKEIKWGKYLVANLSYCIPAIFYFEGNVIKESIRKIFNNLYETSVTEEKFKKNPNVLKDEDISNYEDYKDIAKDLIKDFYDIYEKMLPVDIHDLVKNFEEKLKQKVKYDEIVKDGFADEDEKKVQDAEVLKDKPKDIKEKKIDAKNAIPKANGEVGLKLLINLAKRYSSSKEKISLESISSVLPDYIFDKRKEAPEDNKIKNENKNKGYHENDYITLASELKEWYNSSDESDEKYFLAERINDFIKHYGISSEFKIVVKDQSKSNKTIQSLLPLYKELKKELSEIKSKVSKKMQEVAFGVAKINSFEDSNLIEFARKIKNAMASDKDGIYSNGIKKFILGNSAGAKKVLDTPKNLKEILKDFVYFKDTETKKRRLYEYISFSEEDLSKYYFEKLSNKLKNLDFGNFETEDLQQRLLDVLKTELPSAFSDKSLQNTIRNLITDLSGFTDCIEKFIPKVAEVNDKFEYTKNFKDKCEKNFKNWKAYGYVLFGIFEEIKDDTDEGRFVSKYLVPIGKDFFYFCENILNLRKVILSNSNKNEKLVVSDLDFDYLPNRNLKIDKLKIEDSSYDTSFKTDFEALRDAIDSFIQFAPKIDMETLKIPEKIKGILKYTFMYDKFRDLYISSLSMMESIFSICRWGYEHLDIESMKKDNSDKCKCTKLVLDLLSVFYHHLHKSEYGEQYIDNRWRANECLIWRTEGPGRPYLSSNDVHQGGMGDCSLEATLLSLLTEKDKLLDVFPNRNKEVSSDGHLNGNHITVRLYKVSYNSSIDEAFPSGSYVDIVLDATQLWNKNSGSIFNKSDIMWPHFIEKAMPTFYTKSHYVSFGADNPKTQEVLSLSIDGGQEYLYKSILTGCASKRRELKENNLNSTLSELTKAISSSRAITCGTKQNFGESIEGKVEKGQIMTNGEKIYSKHAYRLVGLIPSKEKVEDTIVVVLNPWNTKESNKINVPLSDFVKYFNEISY